MNRVKADCNKDVFYQSLKEIQTLCLYLHVNRPLYSYNSIHDMQNT
jgi:hypothetical protein